MAEEVNPPRLTSDIYRSDNNGKNFTKITYKLGENVYIRRENGLQRHQNQKDSKDLFVICYDVEDVTKSIIFVTKDGGSTWKRSHVPFVLSGQLRFYPRERLSPWVLTLEDKTSDLYLSLDNGEIWKKIYSNVIDYFWSIYASDSDKTIFVVYKPSKIKNETERYVLIKSSDFGETWTQLLDNVIRVWAPRGVKADIPEFHNKHEEVKFTNHDMEDYDSIKLGRFLYASHYVDLKNQTVQLSVSIDGGHTFNRVYLPTIQPERFYSVLEVEDDSAFIHVDAPNDTGHGVLYVSDITGSIFTESLNQHLYPNHAPVTDFYRVASMRGTYLATRLNPDRTLHTVITHDRGTTWHALGAPTNVPNACQSKPVPFTATTTPGGLDAKLLQSNASATNVSQSEFEVHQEESNSSSTSELWRPDASSNETMTTDSSSMKYCGLQISSQFSIKNRVTAFPPLSITSAPGLILAHGHVATHLKSTPADVYVSSDGGYSWYKALSGPHHYQIANRGGLLVAVPAETLWPDKLRFSTDQGRCWHTIPLHSTFVHDKDNPHHYHLGDKPLANLTFMSDAKSSSTTTNTTVTATNITTITTTTDTFPDPSSMMPSWSNLNQDETVVFTGLVTEPGGRAMAAAVYGYGTSSQRWRVAVVDFQVMTNKCTEDDYEIWTPHSNEGSERDGCLLGVREHFKRLKQDSTCANDYAMKTRVNVSFCPCTIADYECEYGYYRHPESLKCIRNPHVPALFNPCTMAKQHRLQLDRLMGYRLIPGDQCVGGWKPSNQSDQSILDWIKQCPDEFEPSLSRRSVLVVATVILLFCCFLLVCLWTQCRRKSVLRSNMVNHNLIPRLHPMGHRIQNWFASPSFWKRSSPTTFPLDNSYYYDSQLTLWPPLSTTATDQCKVKPMLTNLGQKLSMPPAPPLFRFWSGSSSKAMSDVTNLLDAEEVCTATETTVPTGGDKQFYYDPLGAIIVQANGTHVQGSNGTAFSSLPNAEGAHLQPK